MEDGKTLDKRLAERLAALRGARNWSLDQLAARSGISRATLSRLEAGQTSPTAALLGRLCAAHGLTMSRLLAEVEGNPPLLLRPADQPLWIDTASLFRRRGVSPPAAGYAVELVEGQLPAGGEIAYPAPAAAGLEQHLWMLEGRLELTIDATTHRLETGDCLRMRLFGATHFACPGPAARYLLAIAPP